MLGQGRVVVLRDNEKYVFPSGQHFPASLLGDFHLPQGGQAIPEAIWERARTGIIAAKALRTAPATPPEAILSLVELREQARVEKNWLESDRLREQITDLGWQVQDTEAGPQLTLLTLD